MDFPGAKYARRERIGHGSFGSVYRWRLGVFQWVLSDDLPLNIAVKEVTKQTISREVDIMRQLNHPNLVKYFGAFNVDRNTLGIAMQLCQTSLATFTSEGFSRKPLHWAEAAAVAEGILGGLAYLHGNDIIHRDIKPENILLLSTEPEPDWTKISFDKVCIKIADFGFARYFNVDGNISMTMTVGGTLNFMAPEVREALSSLLPGTHYDASADVYSVGVVIYLLLFGKLPSSEIGLEEAPPRARYFLLNMLSSNRKRRWKAKDLLSHEFIRASLVIRRLRRSLSRELERGGEDLVQVEWTWNAVIWVWDKKRVVATNLEDLDGEEDRVLEEGSPETKFLSLSRSTTRGNIVAISYSSKGDPQEKTRVWNLQTWTSEELEGVFCLTLSDSFLVGRTSTKKSTFIVFKRYDGQWQHMCHIRRYLGVLGSPCVDAEGVFTTLDLDGSYWVVKQWDLRSLPSEDETGKDPAPTRTLKLSRRWGPEPFFAYPADILMGTSPRRPRSLWIGLNGDDGSLHKPVYRLCRLDWQEDADRGMNIQEVAEACVKFHQSFAFRTSLLRFWDIDEDACGRRDSVLAHYAVVDEDLNLTAWSLLRDEEPTAEKALELKLASNSERYALTPRGVLLVRPDEGVVDILCFSD